MPTRAGGFIVAALAVALLAPVAAAAESDPVPLVDGQPVCGVEGTGDARTLPAGELPRVGTYNILHCQGEDDDANVSLRRPQVIDAMAAADADVWGLQEVTNNSEHGRIAELIAEGLAARTGERWTWCWFLSNPHVPGEPDVNEGGGGPLSDQMAEFSNFPEEGDFREGLAIVTRLDIVEARSRRLSARTYEALLCVPPDPIGCNLAAAFDSRQVMWARVDAGPAGAFDMFNTHLAHGLTALSDTTKRIQVEVALATIDEWASDDVLPDFFVGDFNSQPGTDRHARVLEAGFIDSYAESSSVECGEHATQPWRGCTSSQRELTATRTPTVSTRIDHVFARPGECDLTVVSSEVMGTNAKRQPDGRWLWPSDHLGVASSFTCSHER